MKLLGEKEQGFEKYEETIHELRTELGLLKAGTETGRNSWGSDGQHQGRGSWGSNGNTSNEVEEHLKHIRSIMT